MLPDALNPPEPPRGRLHRRQRRAINTAMIAITTSNFEHDGEATQLPDLSHIQNPPFLAFQYFDGQKY